jgi:hypothetical protein
MLLTVLKQVYRENNQVYAISQVKIVHKIPDKV